MHFKKISQYGSLKKYLNIATSKNVFPNRDKLTIENKNIKCVNYFVFKK